MTERPRRKHTLLALDSSSSSNSGSGGIHEAEQKAREIFGVSVVDVRIFHYELLCSREYIFYIIRFLSFSFLLLCVLLYWIRLKKEFSSLSLSLSTLCLFLLFNINVYIFLCCFFFFYSFYPYIRFGRFEKCTMFVLLTITHFIQLENNDKTHREKKKRIFMSSMNSKYSTLSSLSLSPRKRLRESIQIQKVLLYPILNCWTNLPSSKWFDTLLISVPCLVHSPCSNSSTVIIIIGIQSFVKKKNSNYLRFRLPTARLQVHAVHFALLPVRCNADAVVVFVHFWVGARCRWRNAHCVHRPYARSLWCRCCNALDAYPNFITRSYISAPCTYTHRVHCSRRPP